MTEENCIEQLIECVWRAVRSESRELNCYCREKCVDCVTRLVGPDHYYAQCLRDLGGHWDLKHALAALGFLAAAREELSKRVPGDDTDSCVLSKLDHVRSIQRSVDLS